MRSRSKSLDLAIVVLLLVVSAVMARNFLTPKPPPVASSPSPEVASLQVDLQGALERYYESKEVVVQVARLGEASPIQAECKVQASQTRSPRHWVYGVVRFVAARHPAVNLQVMTAVDGSGQIFDKQADPKPGGPRGSSIASQEDWEMEQAERLRAAGQGALDRDVGPGQAVVLVNVKASLLSSPPPTRRSRIRARAPIRSYQVAQVEALVISGDSENLRRLDQRIIQTALGFEASRGDTLKTLALPKSKS